MIQKNKSRTKKMIKQMFGSKFKNDVSIFNPAAVASISMNTTTLYSKEKLVRNKPEYLLKSLITPFNTKLTYVYFWGAFSAHLY